MPDSSVIDAALVSVLASDSTLMALMTDGVYMDVAENGKTKFVIVSLIDHEDDYVFQGESMETAEYLIKAVDRAKVGTAVKTAAARIHTLLQGTPLTLPGYSHQMTRRTERVRYTEVDDVDKDIRWQHRGGQYQVVASPA